MRLTFGFILAIFVGLSLGLIGGGGSILAVPILKYVIGVSTKEAIAMSLFIVGIVSIIGLIPHWRQGNVNFSIALIFIPPAMIGSFLGAKISDLPFINDTIQLVSFGIIMLLASVLMIKKSNSKSLKVTDNLGKHKLVNNKKNTQILFTIIEGFGVGILTGFVGVGGGFLIIPALVLVGGIPMKEAVGTSLIIIAFNSVSGFSGYLNQVELNWLIMIIFSIASSAGIIIGGLLAKKIDPQYLQKGFGYFVLTVAVFVLIVR
ncbi:sulfite exporter TauE/SafE family protein [Geminocystis sp. CENA526]|uniref:sulfite exporter TauE/SafE family protein n=1 Tax=Geminocystis sp. CENA526 TaxID=1355871 RepID=UPI003D6EE736